MKISLQQIDAQVKRSNWRISDIAKRYGSESATYRKETAFLFDEVESKDLAGNVIVTRTVKPQYVNITHFVTTKEGNTYIAIDRTKKAKETFKQALESPNNNDIAKMYNQARNIKTQGQLERHLLGDRYDELQEMRNKKEITKAEYTEMAQKEIEIVNKITYDFQTELNELYDVFTDNEIKKKVPSLYKEGKKTYSELEDIVNLMRQSHSVTNSEKRLPLGG